MRMSIMCGTILVAIFVSGCGQHKDSLITRWETANQTFRIRVSEYAERGPMPTPSGAYYVFESAPLHSGDWNHITTFRHDDQIGIPRDQVRFVHDNIGYVFMGWMYAVTMDGGATWHVWNAEADLPNWQCCNHGLIKEIGRAH